MLKIILILVGVFLLYQVLSRVIRKAVRMPAPPLLGYLLDTRMRRWFQPADKLIERSGIKPGMTVLDLGCGSGAFTFFVARAVGEHGKVYAVDMQPAMLKQLKRKLAKHQNPGVGNIEVKRAVAYALPFADGSIDLVYTVTVLPEIPDRSRALREVSRVLKPGGILAVTEFLPDPDYPLRSTTVREGEMERFLLEGTFGNLWNYTVRFRKPA